MKTFKQFLLEMAKIQLGPKNIEHDAGKLFGPNGYLDPKAPDAPEEPSYSKRIKKSQQSHLTNVIESSIGNKKFYRIAAALGHKHSTPAHFELAIRLLKRHLSDEYKNGNEEYEVDDYQPDNIDNDADAVHAFASAVKQGRKNFYNFEPKNTFTFSKIKEKTYDGWKQMSGPHEDAEMNYDPFHPRSLKNPDLGNTPEEDKKQKEED